MKTKLTPSLFLVAALTAGSAFAAEANADAVSVSFHESDKFTDVRATFAGSTDEGYLDILAKQVKKSAVRYLAAGQKLEVTFTDIDLAGDFIPGNMKNQDIRIIKDIYIPRQKLTFKLLDAEGRVLKEGERRLSDMNFMNNLGVVGRGEPLFYDKALIDEWLRSEFKE